MKNRRRAIARTALVLCTALGLNVILSLSKDAPAAAQTAAPEPAPAPSPSVLVATPTFLMYAEGDRRQPAVGGSLARGTVTYRATDGFLTVEPSSQLLRRYDANGNITGAPFLPLGIAEALELTAGTVRVFLHKCRRHALAVYETARGRS